MADKSLMLQRRHPLPRIRRFREVGIDEKMVIIDHDPQVQGWWYPYDDEVFYPG